MTRIKSSIAAAVLAVVAGPGFAATFTPDTLIGSASLGNSGDATEIAELESLAGLTAGSLSVKSKLNSGSFAKDDAGNYYVDVNPNEPGFFILKFGGTNNGPHAGKDSHYFFRNIAELTKLVWTGSQVNGLLDGCTVFTIGDPCRLSHVTYTDSVTSPVPLPAAGWMLVAGLGGLAVMRRRKKA